MKTVPSIHAISKKIHYCIISSDVCLAASVCLCSDELKIHVNSLKTCISDMKHCSQQLQNTSRRLIDRHTEQDYSFGGGNGIGEMNVFPDYHKRIAQRTDGMYKKWHGVILQTFQMRKLIILKPH